MAKIILEKGNGSPEPEILIMKCPHCGCKFTFEDEDVKHVYTVGELMGAVVNCPECNGLCSSLYNDMEMYIEEDWQNAD